MKRFAVISDTHGNEYSALRAIQAAGDFDAVIHLGDYAADAETICEKLGKPLYAVLGNCDFVHPPKGDFGNEYVLEAEGARILLVHGHRHGIDVYSSFDARQRALDLHCDALLYGHTHIPEVAMKDGILVMNPGSPARPRGGSRPSCGLLIVEDGKLYPRTVTLD
jgi:phosphoesterase, MJ0936 family